MRLRASLALYPFFAAVFFVGAANAQQASMVEVGYVLAIDPANADFQIKRSGKPLDVHVLTPLAHGDQLLRVSPKGRIRVHLNGRSQWLGSSEFPFPIDATQTGGIVSDLLGYLGKMISPDPTPRTVSVQARAEGSKPRLKVFRARRGQVVAGKRELVIEWIDGESPFKVEVKRGEKALFEINDAKSRIWRSPKVEWPVGKVDVAITDARGRSASGVINFVDPSLLPTPPDDMKAMPPELYETMRAAWLASQKRSPWLLESLQIIDGVSNQFSPALELRRRIVKGQIPNFTNTDNPR